MTCKYSIGQQVEHKVSGYDYGAKPQWIPAVVVAFTPQRIKIRFRLKMGKELVRYAAESTVRALNDSIVGEKES